MNEVEAVALEPSPLVVEAMQRMFDRYSDTDEAFFDKLANTEHLMRVFTYVEAQAAIAALDAARGDQVARVVEWLRKENGLCDCHARCETECGCGAWDDWKTKPLLEIATAIERGEPFNG